MVQGMDRKVDGAGKMIKEQGEETSQIGGSQSSREEIDEEMEKQTKRRENKSLKNEVCQNGGIGIADYETYKNNNCYNNTNTNNNKQQTTTSM